MRIIIELNDPRTSEEGFFDALSVQPAGEFLGDLEQALYFRRDAEPFHRLCSHCLASVHCDLVVREQADGGFIAMGLPQKACPHCGSRGLGLWTDPVFRALDGLLAKEKLSERSRDRLEEVARNNFDDLPLIDVLRPRENDGETA